jgi:hypothetical protein
LLLLMKMLHLHGLAAKQFSSAARPLASSSFSHCFVLFF